MASGIYIIESKIKPERYYIGSACDFSVRWANHKSRLLKNKHHSPKLQNHVNKYGIDDLNFIILDECDKDILLKREQFHLDTLKPYFNICKFAYSGLGKKLSEEAKRKISENTRNFSKETREKIRQKLIGRKIPLDVIEKRSSKLRGRKLSEEHKRKMSIARKGKPTGRVTIHTKEFLKKAKDRMLGNNLFSGRKHTEETKKKMSRSMKGLKHVRTKPMDEETKQKISKSNMGKNTWTRGIKRTDATKKKMSEAGKRAWVKRRLNNN